MFNHEIDISVRVTEDPVCAMLLSLEDVIIRMSSTYLETNMHDELQMLSSVPSNLSMYVMACKPEKIDPMGSSEVSL